MMNIVASAARTVTGNSGALTNPAHLDRVKEAIFFLNVTAAASLAGDTLDVYVQSSIDDGTTWDDFVHFTQVLGNGGAKSFDAYWSRLVAPTTAVKAPQDGALAAGVQQGPTGPVWRVKWVIAGTGSFTFSVGLEPIYDRA